MKSTQFFPGMILLISYGPLFASQSSIATAMDKKHPRIESSAMLTDQSGGAFFSSIYG